MAITLFGSAPLTAEASLTGEISGGQSVVYDNVTNITWTGDANLLGTLENTYGYDTIVNAIIAASPTIYDNANQYDTPANSGYHTVSTLDFSRVYNNGEVTWYGAMAFTNYLNSITYAGSNHWILPTTVDSNNSYSNSFGTNNITNTSQLAELYYGELGATYGQSIPLSNHFTNQLANLYWSGTEVSYSSGLSYLSWSFVTSTGVQDSFAKAQNSYAWAVSAGNITAVPAPASVWLFGSGLVGLMGWKRRGNIG